MTVRLVQPLTNGFSTITSLAYGQPVSKFSTLILCVVGTNTISSVTDTLGNTWTQVITVTDGTRVGYIFYVPNCVGSGANTVTWTSSEGMATLWEVSGASAASPANNKVSIDVKSSNTGSAVTADPGNIQPSSANGFAVSGAISATSIGGNASGWTATVLSNLGNEHLILPSSAAIDGIFTSVVGAWVVCQASFLFAPATLSARARAKPFLV